MGQRLGDDHPTAIAVENVGASVGVGEVRTSGTAAPLPRWVHWSRWGFLALAWIFVGCVAAQVFFAGMATFVDSSRWAWHTNFIHTFEFLPLLMLAVAFAARLPLGLRWLTGALYALIWAQYATANIGGVPGAFHPVNALLMFWLAIYVGQRAWRAVREAARPAQVAA
jgi:hypothetical protein